MTDRAGNCISHFAVAWLSRNVGPCCGWGGILSLVESQQAERQRQPAFVKQVAAVIDDGLYLKIVHFTAALQRREDRWFHKKSLFFFAVHPGIMAALFFRVFG